MRNRRLRPVVAASLPTVADAWPQTAAALAEDATWARVAEARWGLCGVACENDGELTGVLLVTPAVAVPRGHPVTSWPRNADAAVLVAIVVGAPGSAAEWDDHGTGRQMVQALSGRLLPHVSCLETAASLGSPRVDAPPAAWLGDMGFAPTDPEAPVVPGQALQLMRLDYRQTVRWRPDVRAAWDLVAGWVHRPVAPTERGVVSGQPGATAASRCLGRHEGPDTVVSRPSSDRVLPNR